MKVKIKIPKDLLADYLRVSAKEAEWGAKRCEIERCIESAYGHKRGTRVTVHRANGRTEHGEVFSVRYREGEISYRFTKPGQRGRPREIHVHDGDRVEFEA
jgi:hypothetical protein